MPDCLPVLSETFLSQLNHSSTFIFFRSFTGFAQTPQGLLVILKRLNIYLLYCMNIHFKVKVWWLEVEVNKYYWYNRWRGIAYLMFIYTTLYFYYPLYYIDTILLLLYLYWELLLLLLYFSTVHRNFGFLKLAYLTFPSSNFRHKQIPVFDFRFATWNICISLCQLHKALFPDLYKTENIL